MFFKSWKKNLSLFAAVFLLAGFALRQPLYDFFISPDGLSIAASEICLENRSGKEIIALVEVVNGATTESFLQSPETLCSASPDAESHGFIRISSAENNETVCEAVAESSSISVLASITDDGKCVWN